MVWYFISVFIIINRTLHGRLEIWKFSSSVVKYFTSECTQRFFSTREEKFHISPRGHVISSINFIFFFFLKTGISSNEKTNKQIKYRTCRDFVTNNVLVSPGTLAKSHESQLRKVWNWKCLGLYVTRQLIWRQTPKLCIILKLKYNPPIYFKPQQSLKEVSII